MYTLHVYRQVHIHAYAYIHACIRTYTNISLSSPLLLSRVRGMPILGYRHSDTDTQIPILRYLRNYVSLSREFPSLLRAMYEQSQ
jgi:hypothetical protein